MDTLNNVIHLLVVCTMQRVIIMLNVNFHGLYLCALIYANDCPMI